MLNPDMHPEIRRATDAHDAAEIALREVISTVQGECSHPRILHAPWRSSEWGSAFKATRLCLCCGKEEESKSIMGDDSGFSALRSNGYHRVVSHDDIWRSRFHGASIGEKS